MLDPCSLDCTPTNSDSQSSNTATPSKSDEEVHKSRKRRIQSSNEPEQQTTRSNKKTTNNNNNITNKDNKRKKIGNLSVQEINNFISKCNISKDRFAWPECNELYPEEDYKDLFAKGLYIYCTECENNAYKESNEDKRQILLKSSYVKLSHPLNISRVRRHINRKHEVKLTDNKKLTDFFGGKFFCYLSKLFFKLFCCKTKN